MDRREKDYQSMLNDALEFNARLHLDRRQRLPFFDSHTGIAQRHSSLWFSNNERIHIRREGSSQPHLYRYPAVQWNKSRRLQLFPGDFLYTANGPDHNNRLTPTSMLSHSSSSTPTSGNTSTQEPVPIYQSSNGRVSATSEKLHPTDNSFQSTKNQERSNDLKQEPNGFKLYTHTTDRSNVDKLSSPVNNNSYSSECPISREQHELTASDSERSSGDSHDRTQILTRSSIYAHIKVAQSNKMVIKKRTKKDAGMTILRQPGQPIAISGNQDEDSSLSKKNNQKKVVCNQNGDCKEVKAEPKAQLINQRTAPLSPQAKTDRPFVCAICDQSYKTRPGLSYHSIHKHDMILPKNKRSFKRLTEPELNKQTRDRKRLRKPLQISETNGARVLRNGKSTREQQPTPESITQPKLHKGSCVASGIDQPDNSITSKDKRKHIDPKGNTCEHRADISNNADGHGLDKNEPDDNDSDETDIIEGMELDEHSKEPSLAHSTSYLPKHPRCSPIIQLVTNDKCTTHSDSTDSRSLKRQNLFCDFCLGTAERNRRTRLPEELISCSNCGSSGHPSCLQFTENVRNSVRKYDWQCIDCKTCSACSAADNEDQLLFCDDCDRSFHTYCLTPPLKNLPDGNWSCNICTLNYQSKKS